MITIQPADIPPKHLERINFFLEMVQEHEKNKKPPEVKKINFDFIPTSEEMENP